MAERPDQEAGGNRVRQVPQANPQNIGDDAGRRREIRAIPRPAFPRPFAEDGGDTQLCCSAAGPLRRGPDVAAGAIWVLTAEAIGIPYRRLRRAVSQGLGKPDQRNADHPQSLTTFFGLRRIDHLWQPSLVELGLTARGQTIRDALKPTTGIGLSALVKERRLAVVANPARLSSNRR